MMRVCNVPLCPELYPASEGAKCKAHRREADNARGTSTERGYATAGHRAFRTAVLANDPVCILCRVAISTVADHYPHSRKELIAAGLDPNDPQYGRGLCKRDHDRETARNQPGGFRQT